MYSKNEFANELINEINKNYDIVRIARWAHTKYINEIRNLDKDTDMAMMRVIAMEEGEEFEYTKDELLTFAKELLNSK